MLGLLVKTKPVDTPNLVNVSSNKFTSYSKHIKVLIFADFLVLKSVHIYSTYIIRYNNFCNNNLQTVASVGSG